MNSSFLTFFLILLTTLQINFDVSADFVYYFLFGYVSRITTTLISDTHTLHRLSILLLRKYFSKGHNNCSYHNISSTTFNMPTKFWSVRFSGKNSVYISTPRLEWPGIPTRIRFSLSNQVFQNFENDPQTPRILLTPRKCLKKDLWCTPCMPSPI